MMWWLDVFSGTVFLARRYSFTSAVRCAMDFSNRWPWRELVMIDRDGERFYPGESRHFYPSQS